MFLLPTIRNKIVDLIICIALKVYAVIIAQKRQFIILVIFIYIVLLNCSELFNVSVEFSYLIH